MTTRWPGAVLIAGLAAGWTSLAAQEPDLRSALADRGAPAAFVDAVVAPVEAAVQAGLPAGPLVDKALEGWAKHVPAARVAAALEQLRTRLGEGRIALQAAGVAEPPDGLVASAAEALARGLSPRAVGTLATQAPHQDAAVAGLMVAASLRAQGLDQAASVRVVSDAYRQAQDAARLYELPSVVAGLTGQGMQMTDLAERIMQGGGLPLPPMAGGAGLGSGRPGQVPPGFINNPGQGKGQQKQGK